MKNYIHSLVIPSLCLSVVACSSASKNDLSKDSAKTNSTVATSTKESENAFKLRPYAKEVLKNGLTIYFVKDTSLPRVSLQALVGVGASNESLDKAGLNAMTAYMLEQGTTTRTATMIADELGQLGTELGISADDDMTTVRVDSLSTSAEKILNVFSDVLMMPNFSEKEIERIRTRTVSAIKKQSDDPSSYASLEAAQYLFGSESRYGTSVIGVEESVKALRKKDLVKHYLTYYRPNNTTIAVVGNFDTAFQEKVKATFSSWIKKNIPVSEFKQTAANEGFKVKLLVKKGLQQTQIRYLHLGIDRKNPDFLALRLGNETLGGGFAGRLNQKIRDDLGLTYSIYSYFDVLKYRGSYIVSTFTKNENAGKVVDEVKTVLENYLKDGATSKEVEASKNQLIGQFPRAIETADRLSYNLMVLDFYGIPHDYLTTYNQQVMALTETTTKAAMQKALNAENFKVLVYGDESIIPQFEKYKPEVVHLK